MFDVILSVEFFVWTFAVIVFISLIYGTFFTVGQETRGVVERFGKFKKVSNPGLNFKIPFIDKVAYRPSLRVQELELKVRTISGDKVSLELVVAIQYMIDSALSENSDDAVKLAVYKLTNPTGQITSYVQDEVIAQVPLMDMDDVFEKKDLIGSGIKEKLDEAMTPFGYRVVRSLVNNIYIDEKVQQSMNEINAARRHRIAAQEKGEADKILAIKAAEAEKETKRLSGEGIAEQRKAIALGFKASLEDLKSATEGKVDDEAIMMMLQMTQFYDTLSTLGNSPANTVFVPFTPGANASFMEQMMAANSVVSKQK